MDALPQSKLAYSLAEVLELQPLSRSAVYLEIQAGRLRKIKVGRRSIFLAEDVRAWLELLRDDQSRSNVESGEISPDEMASGLLER